MDPISAGVVLAKAGAALLGAKTARPVVTAFLDKISDFSGVVSRPWQVRRDAKAEADATITRAEARAKAAIIEAEGEQEIQTIQERAEARRIESAIREQQNLDTIIENAADNIIDDAHPERMQDDWLSNFIDKARLFSDEEMQHLWSQVLAGEANAPGSFSRRTINILANLEKRDAQLFRHLCSFCLVHTDGDNILVIDGIVSKFRISEFFTNRNITYTTILLLEEAGLINFSSDGASISGNDFSFSYHSRHINVVTSPDRKSIFVGEVIFTRAGEELARICQPDADTNFLDYIIERWKKHGHGVEEILTTAS